MDPAAVARFGGPRLRHRFQKEYRFSILGTLAGRRVLDVGCGDGINAVLMARLGATVTGVDVSERAIELARRRAAISGVAERTEFHCSPIEEFEPTPAGFEVIWCDSILHHLAPVLDLIMTRLGSLAAEDAQFIAYEPVSLSPALRRIRKAVPIRTEATPDERPLDEADLDRIQRHLAHSWLRYFALFGRLDRFILERQNYERSRRHRRALSSGLAAVDTAALRLPWFRRFAGRVVICGRPNPVRPSGSAGQPPGC